MRIVCISGLDGCGKTTQARLLVQRLNECGMTAEYRWLRWEPSVLPIIGTARRLLNCNNRAATGATEVRISKENREHAGWRRMKRCLLASATLRRLWLLYATNDYRRAYRKVSAGWKSQFVVLDRYVFDFIADQSINLDVEIDRFLAVLPRSFLADVPMPELAVIIDVPAEVGYARKRDGTSLEYLKERESLYARFTAAGQVLHVDGTQSQEAIHQDIFAWIGQQCGIST